MGCCWEATADKLTTERDHLQGIADTAVPEVQKLQRQVEEYAQALAAANEQLKTLAGVNGRNAELEEQVAGNMDALTLQATQHQEAMEQVSDPTRILLPDPGRDCSCRGAWAN